MGHGADSVPGHVDHRHDFLWLLSLNDRLLLLIREGWSSPIRPLFFILGRLFQVQAELGVVLFLGFQVHHPALNSAPQNNINSPPDCQTLLDLLRQVHCGGAFYQRLQSIPGRLADISSQERYFHS